MDRGIHTPHALLKLIYDPSSTHFNMFELKIFHNGKLLEHSIKMFPVRKVRPRVNSISHGLLLWSSSNIIDSSSESFIMVSWCIELLAWAQK